MLVRFVVLGLLASSCAHVAPRAAQSAPVQPLAEVERKPFNVSFKGITFSSESLYVCKGSEDAEQQLLQCVDFLHFMQLYNEQVENSLQVTR